MNSGLALRLFFFFFFNFMPSTVTYRVRSVRHQYQAIPASQFPVCPALLSAFMIHDPQVSVLYLMDKHNNVRLPFSFFPPTDASLSSQASYDFYKINRVNELKKTSLVSSAYNGTHFGSTNAESEEGAVPIYSQHEIHRVPYTN